jgi:hypothetical protein
MNLPQLNEKAMKVKLTMRRANLTRRDEQAEIYVQQQLDDQSLVVNSKLFRDKTNPINQIMTAVSEVYSYHKAHTIPFVDKGPRLLPNEMYFEYTAAMRERIQRVDDLLATHMPMYDLYVNQDIAWRCEQARLGNKQARASVSDYPTAEEFRSRMGFELRFEPLPDKSHFLFDINEEDMAAFEHSIQEQAAIAHNHRIVQMLEPLKHLAEKLEKPIGTEGSIFRDSAIENIKEGIAKAKKLTVVPTPELEELILELERTIETWSATKEWLRESPINREAAAKQLGQLAQKMGSFMVQ